ncbi:FAD-binding oxidoreductase [Micromonospora sp. NPDC047738]|uniref:FAD-binding oxidoreductase n=1 Tax=Micromonospora sp. NPDC047738 TaxID=3155741 RepID=UPI0034008EAF
MTSINASTDVARATEQLRPVFGDRLLLPTHEGFASASRIWNCAVTHRPVAIVRCLDNDDVRAAVLTAREYDVPLSVRGGGHDWAGRALRDGGLVLDLSGMRQVAVDTGAGTATVGGGAHIGDVSGAGQQHGLVTPTGTVRTVGMAGLTLAGGYGPLCGRYGLAVDNLLRADVVLADGRLVTASPDGDAELFWALRGGGGNFGVVTSLMYRLHELPTVLSGMMLFPFAQASTVLTGYREIVATAADDATIMAGFLPNPDGPPLVFLCPMWSGADLAEGERLIAGLERLGNPVMSQIAATPYHDALSMFDGAMREGNHYRLRTRWLSHLSEAAAEELTDAAAQIASPYSAISMHHFHGAAARVGQAETAFGLRTDHLLVEIVGAWAPEDAEAGYGDWADQTSQRLAPLALPGGYPNLLGADEPERVPPSYGPNYERLVGAKNRYDPDNIFASAVPTVPKD